MDWKAGGIIIVPKTQWNQLFKLSFNISVTRRLEWDTFIHFILFQLTGLLERKHNSTPQENNIKEYPDVIVSSTHYKTPPNITSEMRNNSLLQAAYASDPSPCRTLSCMSHSRLLYDLSVDPSESYDISWRFGHITKHMYELLEGYVNDNAPLPKPVFFEDEHPEALTSDGIWTPWINSTGKWGD